MMRDAVAGEVAGGSVAASGGLLPKFGEVSVVPEGLQFEGAQGTGGRRGFCQLGLKSPQGFGEVPGAVTAAEAQEKIAQRGLLLLLGLETSLSEPEESSLSAQGEPAQGEVVFCRESRCPRAEKARVKDEAPGGEILESLWGTTTAMVSPSKSAL